VYVPSYDPVVVYGPAVYPYPPIYYPPAGYYAAGLAISFGVGVMMGAFWSGGWGWAVVGATTTSTSTTTTISIVNSNVGGNRPSNQPVRGGGNRGNIGGGNAEEMPVGSTILNIAVALPIGTELLPTGSAALREEDSLSNRQQGPGNRLAGRAAIYPAIALGAELARAIGLARRSGPRRKP